MISSVVTLDYETTIPAFLLHASAKSSRTLSYVIAIELLSVL